MKTLVLVIFVCWFLSTKLGLAAENEMGTYLNYSNDIDDVTKYEGAVGYTKHFSKKQYLTTKIGNTEYVENDKSINFSFIDLSGRKNLNENFYLNGNVRYNVGDYKNVTYGFSTVYEKPNFIRVELFTEKSMIDTHLAIENELFFTTYGISTDYSISKDLTLTGSLFTQTATDDNKRNGQSVQLVYSPEYLKGVYVKSKAKFRQGDFDPIEYFMPEDLKRYDILIGYYGEFLNNFGGRVEFGPGIQYLNHVRESAFEYKVSLYGWVTPKIKLEVSYNSTMDNGDVKYNYDWGALSLKYFW